MEKLGEGIAIAAVCALLIVLHPLGWIGMMVIAFIFGAFR